MELPKIPETNEPPTPRQIEAWRRMTPAQKLQLMLEFNAAIRQMAIARIKYKYPDASSREVSLRLAKMTIGDELARKANPDLDSLVID